MKIYKYSIIGMLSVVKPLRILFFIFVWNLLFGLTIWVNGRMPVIGEPKTPGTNLGFALVGAFVAFSGFAPVISLKFRDRWCRRDADFEEGRGGLIILGLIGFVFLMAGLESLIF